MPVPHAPFSDASHRDWEGKLAMNTTYLVWELLPGYADYLGAYNASQLSRLASTGRILEVMTIRNRI